jgi:hypothetical protein
VWSLDETQITLDAAAVKLSGEQGSMQMAYTTSALVTFSLPAFYADGTTAWPAANYGGASVFRDGVQVGTVAAPALSFTDTKIPIGSHAYTVEVKDAADSLFSAMSPAVTYVQLGQAPAAPTITSIVAG